MDTNSVHLLIGANSFKCMHVAHPPQHTYKSPRVSQFSSGILFGSLIAIVDDYIEEDGQYSQDVGEELKLVLAKESINDIVRYKNCSKGIGSGLIVSL